MKDKIKTHNNKTGCDGKDNYCSNCPRIIDMIEKHKDEGSWSFGGNVTSPFIRREIVVNTFKYE